MRNQELECLPLWRFCRVKAGEKVPYPAGWQNNPLTLQEVDSGNIGILLGPPSGGIVALDFDGASAWAWYDATLGAPIPETVSWTSGKAGRCQMAFMVAEEYWPYLKTEKITNTRSDLIAVGEGFEFRWLGGQSVLPPSSLSDGREYTWVAEPSTTDIADLPEAILAYWLQTSNPEPRQGEVVEYPAATESEVLLLAGELKTLYPELDSYELWTSVCWAFCNTIGYADGIVLMKYYWPEKKEGEYSKLISTPTGSKYSIGTVKWLIRQRSGQLSESEILAKKILQKKGMIK